MRDEGARGSTNDDNRSTEADDHPARPPIVTAPLLTDLPLNELSWESFENLLRRVARNVLGLRQVQLYGTRGQGQLGIDIAGRSTNGEWEAIQSKKYEKFYKSDLIAAVEKFLDSRGGIPFRIRRLIVAAACQTDRKEVVDELHRINEGLPDLEIELWGRRRILDSLRTRRDIVTEFFGPEVAAAFCLPDNLHIEPAAAVDKVALADALLRGPASTTGADVHLEHATQVEEADPLAAAREVELAQQKLTAGGFNAFATVLAPRRAKLLQRASQYDEANALLSELIWQALNVHDISDADLLLQGVDSTHVSDRGRLLAAIAVYATDVAGYRATTTQVDLDEVTGEPATIESARLLLLLAEMESVEYKSTWAAENSERLLRFADLVEALPRATGSDTLNVAYRLRINLARATGDWTSLLTTARRHRVPRSIAALILASYALQRADEGDFEEPDTAWEDAIEQACLDGQSDAAAEWVHARRILSSRMRSPSSAPEDAPRLVRALRESSDGSATKLRARLEERALRELAEGRPRNTIQALHSWLIAAHTFGFWGDVLYVRGLLSDAYKDAGEFGDSAGLLIQMGNTSRARALVTAAGDQYIDVRRYVGVTTAYWVPATAFSIIAAQADLVPDEHVEEIATAALDVLRRLEAGILTDTPFFSPSLYLTAVESLASLAERLSTPSAEQLLIHLRPYVSREPNHYRRTDDAHVRACVGTATVHPELAPQALEQLLGLLAAADSGVSHRVELQAGPLFRKHLAEIDVKLRELTVSGNVYAAAVLALANDAADDEQMQQARSAAVKLSMPSKNTANSIGVGTGAVQQSLLARYLPADERKALIRAQLSRAKSPFEPGENRLEYFAAAANLSIGLERIEDLFVEALEQADNANPSQADVSVAMESGPLSSFRVTGMIVDTRPQALHLAAALARSEVETEAVRSRAISLLGVPRAGPYVLRVLRIIKPADLARDVPLLATQPDPAMRALAAFTWVNSSPDNPRIGLLLAGDLDASVRRTLAEALSNPATITDSLEPVKEILSNDRRYSVRKALA